MMTSLVCTLYFVSVSKPTKPTKRVSSKLRTREWEEGKGGRTDLLCDLSEFGRISSDENDVETCFGDLVGESCSEISSGTGDG